MRGFLVILLLSLLLLPVPAGKGAPDVEAQELKISQVYYHNDPGCEYIVLENWGGTLDLDGYALDDGEGELVLPQRLLKGDEKVSIATQKEGYEAIWHEEPDLVVGEEVEMEGQFNLASTGDELHLLKGGTCVDSFYYGNGTGGECWNGDWAETCGYGRYAKRGRVDTDTCRDWNWTREWYVGHSDFPSRTYQYDGRARVFSAPDSSFGAIIGYLKGVENSLNISVYQIDNVRIAQEIANVSRNGTEVNILVEGGPVGAFSDRQMYCLKLIEKSGGRVRLINGDAYSPYGFLHTKYMVADGEDSLFASENFGHTGFPLNPTRGNRGWGVVLRDEELASYYSRVFSSDWSFGRRFEPSEPDYTRFSGSLGRYDPAFESMEIDGNFRVKPVLSPDTSTSQDTILQMIDSAQESISVQQFYIKDWPYRENPYLSRIKRAAERGCNVRILLDSTWYNVQENETDNDDMVERLNRYSAQENFSLEARLIGWEKGFSKVHNKGMIVDGEKVLISSINWNANSVLQNREAGVIVENERLGSYFQNIFDRDWKEDTSRPIADAGRDREVEEGEIIHFSGETCWDESNISLYRWDLDGDGQYDKSSSDVTRLYRESGSLEVKLYVEDEYGNSDTDTVEIKVVEPEEGMVSSAVPGDSGYDAYIAGGAVVILGAAVVYYLRRRDVL